ncbi:MAG: hypothetical protein U9Q30_03020 [Campylobacterota bacterium]|nr:hypothetical protein [Campylobacterota bacterium]
MKKINPVTLLLLLIMLFMVSALLLKKSNQELKDLTDELNNVKIISKEYSTLKRSWNDKKQTLKTLDKIIKDSKIKNLSKDVKNKKITINIPNSSLKKISKFSNKILNSNFIILKFKITKTSLYIEMGY